MYITLQSCDLVNIIRRSMYRVYESINEDYERNNNQEKVPIVIIIIIIILF